MEREEFLIKDLPDPEAARRFLGQLAEAHPSQHAKLLKKEGLLSDVLTLVAFSPLLATTLLQNSDYFWWLGRKRAETAVRSSEDLIESLARFSLTNSQLEPQVLFARFRRRELLRIYLRDIRRLATIAEITEEISNLADAVLESALKLARREMDNRFGSPLENDNKGRSRPARFCIVALGKLGSKELNYSSDIDLVFLYSDEGITSGRGTRGQVTNREYFIKLAEYATKLVASHSGEGAAYRVDLRLRPHGTLGALALAVRETVRYYKTEARGWERQVMIRSRGCAGDTELFREFFSAIESLIFSKKETPQSALRNVRLSKEKINLEHLNSRGYNVKLGHGGIREIEFIAQALQLAHGGRDKWLRSPHTLISLDRLADRHLLTEAELTGLASAYEFLRRTEHILQMENGIQTHTVPDDPEKRNVLARRMTFAIGDDFENGLQLHTMGVSSVFSRVFGEAAELESELPALAGGSDIPNTGECVRSHILASIRKSGAAFDAGENSVTVLKRLTEVSPHFAQRLAANPSLAVSLPNAVADLSGIDYTKSLLNAVESAKNLGGQLSALRQTWSRHLIEIVVLDVFERISIRESKRLQTNLAEASITAALCVVREQLAERYNALAPLLPEEGWPRFADGVVGGERGFLNLAILALGKLGGRGIDYDSDLDLILVYDDEHPVVGGVTNPEFYSRAVELFVNTLSSMTRHGNLYRVDLRLRPYGSKGMSAMSARAFLEYMRETAAIWEMLAFVKLRAVGGDTALGTAVENESRFVIHNRALAVNADEFRQETLRIRLALEQQRAHTRRGKEIDIKYGSGGMLDVYFALRYLQLRDNIPDGVPPGSPPYKGGVAAVSADGVVLSDRSTTFMLKKLFENKSLSKTVFTDLLAGYAFLSALDHNLRLTVGRTNRVPLGNETALKTIAARMKLASPADLLEQLTLHRLAIRSAFDSALS